LGEQHVHPPDIARGFGLRDDDRVEVLPRPGHYFDDVVVAPPSVETVDADGACGAPPIDLVERSDRLFACVFFEADRYCVLEVEECQVGTGPGSLGEHIVIARRHRQLGATE
jgi:hypothetical protein